MLYNIYTCLSSDKYNSVYTTQLSGSQPATIGVSCTLHPNKLFDALTFLYLNLSSSIRNICEQSPSALLFITVSDSECHLFVIFENLFKQKTPLFLYEQKNLFYALFASRSCPTEVNSSQSFCKSLASPCNAPKRRGVSPCGYGLFRVVADQQVWVWNEFLFWLEICWKDFCGAFKKLDGDGWVTDKNVPSEQVFKNTSTKNK